MSVFQRRVKVLEGEPPLTAMKRVTTGQMRYRMKPTVAAMGPFASYAVCRRLLPSLCIVPICPVPGEVPVAGPA